MVQVGDGVEVPLKGDASGVRKAAADAVSAVDKVINKSDQLQKALNDVNITSKLTNQQLSALQKEAAAASAKVASLSQQTSAGADAAKNMGAMGLKANAAMQTMGVAAGGASAEVGKLVAGASNMAMAFATGGPVGVALAAFGVAISVAMGVFDGAVEKQLEKTKRLEDRIRALTDAAVEMRDKASGGDTSAKTDLLIAQNKGGTNAISDAVAEKQIRALQELETINTARLATTTKIADLERLMGQVYDPAIREEQEAMLQALKSNADSIRIAAKATLDQFDLAPKIGAELERQAKASKDKAEYERLAAQAIKEQADLLRSRSSSAWMAGQLPNGGLLQPGAMTAGGSDAVAPAFSQLSTAGMKLDMNSFSPPASAFEDMGGALARVTQGLGAMSGINLPEMTKSLYEARQGLKDLEDQGRAAAAGLAGDVVSGVMGQGGFNTAGATAGAAIGGVVDAAFGGATGGAGATIGTILGAALGGVLDQLVDVLGVITPLMDGVAVAISALSPIFQVLRMLSADLGKVFIDLAPVIMEIAKPLAAILLMFVRLIEAMLPFVGIVLLAAAAILQWLGFLTAGIKILDEHFFSPMVSGATKVYNGFVDFYNALIDLIRQIPGMEEFGTKASSRSEQTEDLFSQFALSTDELAKIMGDNTDATADNTAATADQFNREMQNLPSGYRTELAEYESQDPQRGGIVFRDLVVNIAGFHGMDGITDSVKDYARRGSHTGRKGNARTSIPDWRN